MLFEMAHLFRSLCRKFMSSRTAHRWAISKRDFQFSLRLSLQKAEIRLVHLGQNRAFNNINEDGPLHLHTGPFVDQEQIDLHLGLL
jgi:hypothetical protein